MKKNLINRSNEITTISYAIPDSEHIIVGRKHNGNYLIKTDRDIFEYNRQEVESIYMVDIKNSNLERLTWTS